MEYDRIECYCSCPEAESTLRRTCRNTLRTCPECESHLTYFTNAVQTPYAIPANLCHHSREWGGWLRGTKSGTNTMPGNASNADGLFRTADPTTGAPRRVAGVGVNPGFDIDRRRI